MGLRWTVGQGRSAKMLSISIRTACMLGLGWNPVRSLKPTPSKHPLCHMFTITLRRALCSTQIAPRAAPRMVSSCSRVSSTIAIQLVISGSALLCSPSEACIPHHNEIDSLLGCPMAAQQNHLSCVAMAARMLQAWDTKLQLLYISHEEYRQACIGCSDDIRPRPWLSWAADAGFHQRYASSAVPAAPALSFLSQSAGRGPASCHHVVQQRSIRHSILCM